MILGMTFYQIMWFFIIYSFLGWIVEVVFQAGNAGKIVNRGFLNGPVCPIYGVGMVTILAALNLATGAEAAQVSKVNAGLIFVGATVLASVIELVAGWILFKLFHVRWWDYTDDPFNIGGYVCPIFSLGWGLGAVLVIRVVHPVIYKLVEKMPVNAGIILAYTFIAIYLIDIILTVLTLIGINKRLKELDGLNKSMRIVSDNLSEVIGEGSLATTKIITESATKARVKFDENIKNTSLKISESQIKRIQIKEELHKFMNGRKRFEINRMVKAFPNLKESKKISLIMEVLEEYKNKKKKSE